MCPAQAPLQGHELIEGYLKAASKYEVHVAKGPGELDKGNPGYVQVMNPLRFGCGKGIVIEKITPFEGSLLLAKPEELKALMASHKVMEEPYAQVDMGEAPEDLRGQLMGLVEKYKSLWDGTLGLIKNTVHRIHLKPEATPICQIPYKTGHRHREKEKEQVEKMCKLEVIEQAIGEWASPIVIVPKPDATPRFCIDYRRLNQVTVKDAYPFSRMDECLEFLGDAQVFSMLDCNVGHWQIQIAPEDKHLTAFTCHEGTWHCERFSFGFCNAAATFQRTNKYYPGGSEMADLFGLPG